MKKIYKNKYSLTCKCIIRTLVIYIFISCQSFSAAAQCPPNIDFEEGTFNNWECWVGNTYDIGGKNEIRWDVPPVNMPVNPALHPNRFQIMTTRENGILDPFGQFPVRCPNGSGNSIKLGNQSGGHEAEGASYTFTIPAGQNQFNIIFNYAVVFQGPVHAKYEQPRLVIEVMNLTDNLKIDCSSFEFFKDTSSTAFPGFFLSTTNNTGTPVWCKNWSAASIKLDGYAGKTLRIFFKTADCVFQAHFGYAYVDVNTECSSSFVGAVYCRDDTAVNVTAPFGYETYRWWDNADPTQTTIATTQTINFNPPPVPGSIYNVDVTPYAGYGCNDTYSAQMLDTLTIQSQAGPDRLSCQNAPMQLGVNPRPNYVYSWSPGTGLSDSTIANPIATPSVTTEYVVTTSSAGGGCVTTDTVIVSAAVLDTSLQITGPLVGCIQPSQPTILKVNAADSIQWYRNTLPIAGANDTVLNVIQTGTYHATVFSFVGCSLSTADVNITVNPFPTVGFTTNNLNQCFNGNQFIFTDTSSIAFGTLSYNWNLGDATTATTPDVTHSYLLPGTYIVKQLVTSDQGCADSTSYTVNVYDSPVAGFFNESAAQQCFKNHQFVFKNTSTLAAGTMQYTWDFGDTNTDTSRNVTHTYALAGTYTVRLTVTSDKGCPDDSTFDVTIHPEPVIGFSVANAQQCFTNNQFNFINSTTLSAGTLQYQWYLGDTNTATTRDVTHSYLQPGDYTVKMVATSDKGCADSTTQAVKIFRYPLADFFVQPVCVNLQLPITNRTINNTGYVVNYLWDFGNGTTSNAINPVYSYPAPGTYQFSLGVNTAQCPQTVHVKTFNLVIDAPAPAVRYPDREVVMNFKEQLQARQIGNSVLWTPATSLDFPGSYRPNFKGLESRLYNITLKTLTGCITVDTQFVKTRKKIEIYVPTSFTPNGDGLNDYLKPFTLSFKSVTAFRVYNRWGKLLFQMQSDQPGWDGRFNGQMQEMQTVVWMIEAIDVDGNVHKKQGTTILLR